MEKLIIRGGNKLEGKVRVPGGKNTVLPILAATIISGKKSVIKDCPKISDVELTIEILKDLGCKVEWDGNDIIVDSDNVFNAEIKEELMQKMRSSVIFLGALISRMNRAKTSYPGGCELGLRPIDLHIKSFLKMGISVTESHGYIICDGKNRKETEIHLDFPSVGATENIMLAASSLKGKTTIINAAKEPEIVDLQEFLIKMGVNVKGAGTSIVEIEGTTEFKDVTHTIIPDRIVASTYMAAAAITGGKVEIENVCINHIGSVISAFNEIGTVVVPVDKKTILAVGNKRIKPLNLIRTSPYPGFPTDVQSVLTAVLSVSKGTSMVVESIFEQRFKLVEELVKMGADITVNEKCAVIKGVPALSGAKVVAPDLRSGAALCVAALFAEGETEISNLHYIKRGYEDLGENLKKLGADIEKVTLEG